MVHLSVAIGRFFEALLLALARSIGLAVLIAVGALALLSLLLGLGHSLWQARKRRS